MGFLDSLGAAKWIVIGVFGFSALWMIGAIIFMKNKKKKNNNWLEENINASKIFIKQGMGTLTVISVDNEKPRTFIEGRKSGIFLNAGDHAIESAYQTVRPGVVYKTVTTNYGPSKQKIKVEANIEYEYSFDLKKNQFVFAEPGASMVMKEKVKSLLEEVHKDKTKYAHIYNYINIEQLDEKQIEAYPMEATKVKKGLLASKVEVVYVTPGEHIFVVFGNTYQTNPVILKSSVEAGKFYCLGANEDGAYLEERAYDWVQQKGFH